MSLTPRYLHIGSAPVNVKNSLNGPLEKDDTKKNTNVYNPIFNFDQTFVDKLQGINQLDLAQSEPYVSLRTRNASGEILQDLNMSFFHRAADLDTIGSSELRYPNRPIMSLKSLNIKTTNASGWMYYTMLNFDIKIHSPDALQNSSLFALVTPEMPLELEYGWNSPDDFLGLNNQEKLMFQVTNYKIGFDETGQIDLKVEGMAFNERLNNTLLGDVGQDLSEGDYTTGKQFNSLAAATTQLKENQAHLDTLNAKPNSGPHNTDVIRSQAENYQTVEKSARGPITNKFGELMKRLNGFSDDLEVGKKKKRFKVVTLHDIIWSLCHETFTAMSDLFVGATEFNVVYGRFNSKAGGLKDASIADFPVHLDKLKRLLRQQRTDGRLSISIEALFNLITGNFIENEEYLKTLIPDKEAKAYVKPDVNYNMTNHAGKIELQIIDIKSDIPVTTVDLMEGGNMTPDKLEGKALDNNLAILRLGHASSFIKDVNLEQMTDQYMKSALIARMHQDRLESQRSNIVLGTSQEAKPADPLHLPLRGTANVLGHTQWKPFRAFYLAAGFFLIDGVYKITGVSHHLDASGFKTKIDFIYH